MDSREESNIPEHECDQTDTTSRGLVIPQSSTDGVAHSQPWCIGNILKAQMHCKGQRNEKKKSKTKCDCEETTRTIDEQVAKRAALCMKCSLRRGNGSQRQQRGAGAWTTQCQGQKDGNETVTEKGRLPPGTYQALLVCRTKVGQWCP